MTEERVRRRLDDLARLGAEAAHVIGKGRAVRIPALLRELGL